MTAYRVLLEGHAHPLTLHNEVVEDYLCNGMYYPWFRELLSGYWGDVISIRKVDIT